MAKAVLDRLQRIDLSWVRIEIGLLVGAVMLAA
jgi:hypothetical protein